MASCSVSSRPSSIFVNDGLQSRHSRPCRHSHPILPMTERHSLTLHLDLLQHDTTSMESCSCCSPCRIPCRKTCLLCWPPCAPPCRYLDSHSWMRECCATNSSHTFFDVTSPPMAVRIKSLWSSWAQRSATAVRPQCRRAVFNSGSKSVISPYQAFLRRT